MSSGPDGATVLERILAPLVNNNEPEAQVVEIHGTVGAQVEPGDLVCTLETSKSTVDVEVEVAGFLGPFAVTLDDRIMAGDPIVDVLDRAPTEDEKAAAPPPRGTAPRLTKKAEAKARELGVDLSGLPTDRILTERDITALAPQAASEEEVSEAVLEAAGERSIVVFGAGGLGRSLVEVIQREGSFDVLCVVDDAIEGDLLGVPIVGGRGLLGQLRNAGARHGVNAVGGIGRMKSRIAVFDLLAAEGFEPATIVDPGAIVSPSAQLEPGVHAMPGAVVWSLAQIGRNALLNTNVVVSHDCVIGQNVHLAPGATLAGETTVGEGTLVGMGVTTRVGARIGARSIVGNGVVVNDDIPDGTIVPSGTVWPSSAG